MQTIAKCAGIAALALMLPLPCAARAPRAVATYQSLIAEARADLAAGKLNDVLAETRQATGKSASPWEAWLIAGGALQMLGRTSEAEIDYKQAIAAAPVAKKSAIQGLIAKMDQEQATALLSAGRANLDQRTQIAGRVLNQGMADAERAADRAGSGQFLAALEAIAGDSGPSTSPGAAGLSAPFGGAGAGTMSAAQQQAEAQRLSSLCNNDPTYRRWLQQAQAGSISASYRAAAALLQCYYNNVGPNYPAAQKQQWLQAIQSNLAQAQATQG